MGLPCCEAMRSLLVNVVTTLQENAQIHPDSSGQAKALLKIYV